jgi:8-oxo-dGTP diphosphatase
VTAVTSRLVVAAAIVDDLDLPRALLAARRSFPPEMAGLWEFPGGKVERGETPEDALRRELREELGVDVELGAELPGPDDGGIGADGSAVGKCWSLGTLAAPAHPLVMRLWLARVTSGVPRPLEDHDEVRWLGPGEWRDVPWIPADLAIVDALLDEVVKRHRATWC